MEFPGTTITKPVRFGIMLFFVLSFFIVTPFIILYTMGYRYDFKNKIVSATGAINIDINPDFASVYIDGVKNSDSLPLRLKDKMPGKYLINITAPGFFDWQKIVEVRSKQTVYIKDASMIEKNDSTIIVDKNIVDFSLSSNGDYLVYHTAPDKSGQIEILLKNSNTSEEKNILYMSSSEKVNFTWAKNNNFLAISDTGVPHNTLILINADNTNESINLIESIRYPVTKFEWRDSSEPEFYYSTELKLISMLPDTGQRLVLANNTFEDWYMDGDILWTIEKNSSTNKIILTEDVLGFKKIFADETVFSQEENDLKILMVKDGQILLKKNNRSEMILLTKDKKFNLNGEKFLVSQFNDWWIIWTPWEIWTYTKNSEPLLLNRTGQQLQKVVPLDNYNTLALNWAEKTTILFPYYLVTHDLIEQSSSDIFANTNKRLLYFTKEVDGNTGIWQLKY